MLNELVSELLAISLHSGGSHYIRLYPVDLVSLLFVEVGIKPRMVVR